MIILSADAQRIFKPEPVIMAGYENIIFGKALGDLGGTDGVLPEDL